MSSSFDLYVARRSWLHDLDPRTKLAFMLLSLIFLLSVGNLLIMIGFLVASHLILLSAHIPWSRIRWIWERMLPLTVLILILWPLFYQEGGEVLLELWRVRVTAFSLVEGAAMALRVDALAFACFILLLSTSQSELVRGLVKGGLPFSWGLTLAIALRYLPTLYGIYTTVSEAQQARGWAIGRGDLVKRLRSYMPVLVAVIITALRMTDNLSMALAARAFGARRDRTYLKEVRFRTVDGVLLAGMAGLFLALMVARFWFGFGAEPW
ncbi:MAG TPA: energy-coupling factor transporter transmembrane protein EcfT [Anaerolineae bacterium]|nr:energy-coupling factor transporter transmembrane protein EcfT [Anaerolineae bacterium]